MTVRKQRFAIYTRKSSEEGLEQDFNSLHAQREACEAYIASQRHEGWCLVKTAYDDGGLSGGTMERPALTQLLGDIDRGLIDGVVVYKVDRLTRSLTDFARIVERFDARSVSFVSVTQSFNTTSSMGRLTLNMLLSFAQFEREVTGERIRDKISQSKAKGMWMGGWVPFGYEPDGRTLSVNPIEADIVRTLFKLYLELGTIPALVEDCVQRKLVMPERVSMAGRPYGGGAFTRGRLHKLLSNPIYVGKIRHGDQVHEGQHPAIIDQDVFDAVQRQLSRRCASYRKGTTQSLRLLGKLVDGIGALLTATHAKKGSKRYHYYVGSDLRLPAQRIEQDVITALRAKLADQSATAAALRNRDGSLDQLNLVIEGSGPLSALSDDQLFKRIVRVTIDQNEMRITVRLNEEQSRNAFDEE